MYSNQNKIVGHYYATCCVFPIICLPRVTCPMTWHGIASLDMFAHHSDVTSVRLLLKCTRCLVWFMTPEGASSCQCSLPSLALLVRSRCDVTNHSDDVVSRETWRRHVMHQRRRPLQLDLSVQRRHIYPWVFVSFLPPKPHFRLIAASLHLCQHFLFVWRHSSSAYIRALVHVDVHENDLNVLARGTCLLFYHSAVHRTGLIISFEKVHPAGWNS